MGQYEFGCLVLAGTSFDEHGERINVFECLVCGSRQFSRGEGCLECKKREVKAHHEEEGSVGLL